VLTVLRLIPQAQTTLVLAVALVAAAVAEQIMGAQQARAVVPVAAAVVFSPVLEARAAQVDTVLMAALVVLPEGRAVQGLPEVWLLVQVAVVAGAQQVERGTGETKVLEAHIQQALVGMRH
jgi:hypothetical protein